MWLFNRISIKFGFATVLLLAIFNVVWIWVQFGWLSNFTVNVWHKHTTSINITQFSYILLYTSMIFFKSKNSRFLLYCETLYQRRFWHMGVNSLTSNVDYFGHKCTFERVNKLKHPSWINYFCNMFNFLWYRMEWKFIAWFCQIHFTLTLWWHECDIIEFISQLVITEKTIELFTKQRIHL